MKKLFFAAAAIMFAFSASASESNTTSNVRGIGPLRIGMSFVDLKAAVSAAGLNFVECAGGLDCSNALKDAKVAVWVKPRKDVVDIDPKLNHLPYARVVEIPHFDAKGVSGALRNTTLLFKWGELVNIETDASASLIESAKSRCGGLADLDGGLRACAKKSDEIDLHLQVHMTIDAKGRMTLRAGDFDQAAYEDDNKDQIAVDAKLAEVVSVKKVPNRK